MAYFLLLIFVIVVFHFVYEGIIARSLRLYLRFRLFGLRDELRRIRIEKPSELSDKDFRLYQEYLNNAINLMPEITIHAMLDASKALARDTELVRTAKRRLAVFEGFANCEVNLIWKQARQLLIWSLIVNSGGWFVWLFPFVIIRMSLNSIRTYIEEVTSLPRSEVEKLVPNMTRRAA